MSSRRIALSHIAIWIASPLFACPRLCLAERSTGSLLPARLTCEGVHNPLGIEGPHPRLSWISLAASPALHGVEQSAYRILVASEKSLLDKGKGDLWDTGIVKSGRSLSIPYSGIVLKSATRYWWKVQLWDAKGELSPWSQPAFWDTGLLSRDAWHASWIVAPKEISTAGAPLFTRNFDIKPGWRYARAFVCSLGYHTLSVNNAPADNRLLEPAQTDYPIRAIYSCYDISAKLKKGENTLGIMLGKGWYDQDRVWGGMSYGAPSLLVSLDIEYPDGHHVTLGSDATWKVVAGPILRNNIYAGEEYDARKEGKTLDGSAAIPLTSEPTAKLFSCPMPPIRAIATRSPVRITEIAPGKLVYDMGQNMAGWAKLRVRAEAGTRIVMRFAEALDPKTGQIDTASTGVFATGVEQVDAYICKGGGEETWEPRFTYHGFRYVEVTGLPTGQKPISLVGVEIHTDVRPIGQFVCSDEMVNRIHRAAINTLVGNLHGHPTDCPARERCGWLGDAHGCAEMAALNFDMANFWTKYVGDIETSWKGSLPSNVAPGKRITGSSGNPDWGVAVVLIPWYRYLYYGDNIQLERDYPLMARYVRELAKQTKDGIVTNGYGDWCPPGSVTPLVTPVPLTSTAWFIKAAQVTASTARQIGRNADADTFDELARKSLKAFQSRFFRAENKSFGSQTGDAIALAFDLVPQGQVNSVGQDLLKEVQKHQYHHNTGIFGSRFLFDELTRAGYGDAAWRIIHQTDYPSIGHLFSLGATTFWECWGEPELDKKWGARSLNHPMQAAYDAWFFQGLAGIRPAEDGPGFKKFTIRPQFIDGLDWVRASYESPYGTIRAAWKKVEGTKESKTSTRTEQGGATAYRIEITVPPNTVAEIILPGTVRDTVPSRIQLGRTPDPAQQPKLVTRYLGSGSYSYLCVPESAPRKAL